MAFFEVIEHKGDVYKIVKEIGGPEKSIAPYVVEITESVAKKVRDDLTANKHVYINSQSGQVTVSGKGDDKGQQLSPRKKVIETQIRHDFERFVGPESSVNMVIYVDSLMTLADAGFFITDENREEKYIEIIETGDEKLITLLEEYITVKDDMNNLKWHKQEMNKKLKKLNELDEESDEFKEFVDSL